MDKKVKYLQLPNSYLYIYGCRLGNNKPWRQQRIGFRTPPTRGNTARALPSYVTSFSSVDNVQMCAEVSVELDFCHLYLCWTVYICTQNSDLAYACSNFKAVSKW